MIDASWQQVYGQRADNWRLPGSESARKDLAVRYSRDGYWLLEQACGPQAPGWLAGLPAVQVLRRIWIQQYYRDGEKVVRREEREHGLPSGRDKLCSPYDLDARYSEKHKMSWEGYKAHFTETVSDPADGDPDTRQPALPNLISDVQTTHAAVPDVMMTEPVHVRLQAAGLLPGEHDVDSGYMSADLLVSSRQRGITLVGPLLADTSAQARTGGYAAAMFAVDFDRKQVTCPGGAVSSKWAPMRQHDGKEAISVRFAAATCRDCPARGKCTTAVRTGRQLFLRPREIHEAVTAARRPGRPPYVCPPSRRARRQNEHRLPRPSRRPAAAPDPCRCLPTVRSGEASRFPVSGSVARTFAPAFTRPMRCFLPFASKTTVWPLKELQP